jgi:CheY-like chemotaxis protein
VVFWQRVLAWRRQLAAHGCHQGDEDRNGEAMRTILLVDEVPDLRLLERSLLEDEGYTVIHTLDGMTARLLLCDSLRAMIVLLNTTAHHGAGLLAAAIDEALLRRHAYVLLTAIPERLSPTWRRLLMRLSVPVVAKPFDLDTLLYAVSAAAAHLDTTDGPPDNGR